MRKRMACPHRSITDGIGMRRSGACCGVFHTHAQGRRVALCRKRWRNLSCEPTQAIAAAPRRTQRKRMR